MAYYTSEGFFYWRRAYIYDVAIPDLAKSSNKEQYKHVLDAPTMYEAQKWLREEKSIYVTVGCPLIMNDGLGWSYEVCDKPWNGYSDDDCLKASGGAYDSYEEALSEGVRTSIKILQDEQKENN